MKEKLLNRFGLKVISLVLAFIVWMAIVNISNPIISDKRDVTVEVLNEDVLEKKNLYYEISGKDVITVNYKIRTRDQSLISAKDFHAYIDLEDYNVTEAVPVTIEISKEKEDLLADTTLTAKPMVIRIKTEKLQQKQFELQPVEPYGTPEEGYALGLVTVLPNSVKVKGPETLIGQINHMGIEISDKVEGASADFDATTEPVFYDANNNKLDFGDQVTVDKEEVSYHVSILKAKNLTLDFEVKGQVADGYRFTGVESDVKAVPVVGTKSVLASVSTLSIADEKLDITGATKDKVVALDISNYLPPSTVIAGDKEQLVQVTLKIEPLTTKVFSIDLDKIEKQGSRENSLYTFDKESVDVTVKGLKEDLDMLDIMSFNVLLDVDGLSPGIHPGALKFEVGEGFEVVNYSAFKVDVTSKEDTEITGSDDVGPGESVPEKSGAEKESES